MDNSLETGLDDMGDEAYEDGVAKVTSNGFVRKVLVSFPKQVPMFESEVHAEFTWPPRPVVEGESFRVSRASSGIRKGAAYTPMPKHWPEENSMHSKQESAELYGTVLKARDKRLAQMLNRQKQKLLKMLSYRPGITLKSVNDVKEERENRLKSIKTYKSPLKVEKIKRMRVKKRVPRSVYKVPAYPSSSKKQPPKKKPTKQKVNEVNDVTKKQIHGQYDISMSPPTVKTGDYLIDLGNTKSPDLEWEIAKPKNKYTTAVNKRKRPSSAPATKLDYTNKTTSLEDWSKELGSPGFKTTDLSQLKNSTLSRRNLPTRNIIKGPPQRVNNNSGDVEATDIRDLQKNSLYGNASELSITSPSRRKVELKDETGQLETGKEASEAANQQKNLDMTKVQSSEKSGDATKNLEHNGIQEGSSILLPWDQAEAKLIHEGMQINRQRSIPKGEHGDPASSVNPIYKLDTDPKPVRMPVGNFNDMMIGPAKDAVDDYQNEILRLKLEYMLKTKKQKISVSEEKLIENEVYIRQQEKDLKAQMRGRTNLRASNKKRQVSKATRSRDSIFHPSDKLRKSRSTGRMGNRYTVPIPEIKQDKSPVVGFGYRRGASKVVSRMNKQNPMELVRSLSRQSQQSRKSRERKAPPEGWDMHVHIDGTDFFVNKVTKESVRNIPKSATTK